MDENTKEENNTLTSSLKFILTIFAIFAPIFYLIGLSFYQGKLAAYGVSPEVFPISIQATYVYAYSAIIYLLLSLFKFIINSKDYLFSFPGLWWLIGFTFTTTAVLYIYFKRNSFYNHNLKYKFIIFFKNFWHFIHWNNNNFSKAIGLAGLVTYLLFSIFILLAAGVLIWILPLLMGFIPGDLEAEKKISYYLEYGCTSIENKRWGNCTILQSKDGEILYEGILVASSEKFIAFFTETGAVIAHIPEGSQIINKLEHICWIEQ